MLHNFLFAIYGLQGGLTLEKREQQCIDYIRRTVGRAHAETLLQDDDNDNGFLRKDESEQVIKASLTFYYASSNMHRRQALSLYFHKDEVRALGCELGLPAELLEHHPFPGPGLLIRIICMQVLIRLVVNYVNIAGKKHALLNRIEIATAEEKRHLPEELSSHNQCDATLLPIRTVGVQVQEIHNLNVFGSNIDICERMPPHWNWHWSKVWCRVNFSMKTAERLQAKSAGVVLLFKVLVTYFVLIKSSYLGTIPEVGYCVKHSQEMVGQNNSALILFLFE
ncbi:hypothetical protein GHT06_013782 [Daphnia sinensis]|uniref:Uncharacterized protein n=1 Tax=Daphnia sinensis TaxID=1820382 RepID=A0AAD5KSP7_9CRUS|nr:hypothetical protein GHT06_013782 [Daphnia sinensis]